MPAPAPYREPLFTTLAAHDQIGLRVIYSSPRQTSWDQPAEWFAGERSYDAVYLRAYELPRRGRTPVLAQIAGIEVDELTMARVVAALASNHQPVEIDRTRIDRQIRELPWSTRLAVWATRIT